MKYSKQRNLILEIVKSTCVHPSAEWVYEQARKVMPSIGIATVYRNLNRLADIGEIDRISGLDGVERFDGNTERHYHLKCRECGRVLDLTAQNSAVSVQMETMVRELFDVQAQDVRISTSLLEGVCEECSTEMIENGGEK